MRAFAALYTTLERLSSTNEKRQALEAYFAAAAPRDAAWAIWLLCGGKVSSAKRKVATASELRTWVSEVSGVPAWLVEDVYSHVGDLAETVTLLLDDPLEQGADLPLSNWIEDRLLAVANAAPEVRRGTVVDAWVSLTFAERLVFNKLLTGSLRIGVSQANVQQALARLSGVDIALIAQRMLGNWQPTAEFMLRLTDPAQQPGDATTPYPFYLASPLETDVADLGAPDAWVLEWKWDGIRAQLIRREGSIALWSRGEERMDGRFPELETALHSLAADAVLDGEILAWPNGASAPDPFIRLQRRIQRQKPSAKMMQEVPVRAQIYDLLELNGQDLRGEPLQKRRALLGELLERSGSTQLLLSPEISARSWDEAARLRAEARQRGVEGLMLKRRDSTYKHGRKRGDWWKWKIDPLTVDAVLIYAQAGHGRRSTLHTDYTFALWQEDKLVPVAKAYSGLTDAEILKLDRWIRSHTSEKFGPVRAVEPHHVFEIGFEAVNSSTRHKSGVAVRFPRILRWREDKRPEDADSLDTLRALAR